MRPNRSEKDLRAAVNHPTAKLMSWESEHYRTAFANAAVRLSIDPRRCRPRSYGAAQLFDATDSEGSTVTIAIDGSSWETLFAEFGRDSLAELEQLALTGGWENHADGRVWRVNLI